ncbi:hypothetical protein SAMD00019534_031070 [Acytostelium subglobosum LB1]|uniref:hypothetical protein n=1 Tax=Acytostelium subglobosum LB1 TaxID=1410327 RepID=UPI000644A30D|nr:hypothetical protein SAMD00019534_031070 [Acytostelium subglobosum LB1]GAM19932.1 hypothetical protein SAMD00019534_031070 [Acytostelium subglobosum LB1]|eukprot:XP_012756694.1 hypothetical protein SAMD00019534_031070 [Acytostelium subglobosum LB1]
MDNNIDTDGAWSSPPGNDKNGGADIVSDDLPVVLPNTSHSAVRATTDGEDEGSPKETTSLYHKEKKDQESYDESTKDIDSSESSLHKDQAQSQTKANYPLSDGSEVGEPLPFILFGG